MHDAELPPHTVSRRMAVQQMAAGLFAAPAILRRRYQLAPGAARVYSARAIRLVQESVVVDLLNQFRFADFADTPPKSTLWLTKPNAMTPSDFETYRTSGYNVIALGHSPSDYADGDPQINAILGGNASRVLSAIWEG